MTLNQELQKENRWLEHCQNFLLNYSVVCRYTELNIAATPLNNAQPWRLFLCPHSGGLND